MKHLFRVVFALLIGCLLPMAASAEFVGIPRDEFQPHYTPQLESNWCWASSAAMVMSYQGVSIPQQEIVAFIKSRAVNQTAQPREIIRAVNAVFLKEIDGVPSHAVMSGQYVLGAPIPVILYNQLKQKKPIIMTYVGETGFGHAVVVTGIEATFEHDILHINKVYVFDPYAYNWTPWGSQFDSSKIYKDYVLHSLPMLPNGDVPIRIQPGVISGMILMNSSVDPISN